MSGFIEFEVRAELSEDERWVDVKFDFDINIVQKMHEIASGRFIGPELGGPLWRFPLDVMVGKQLRRAFGSSFKAGPKYKKWALRDQEVAITLRSLSSGDTATLLRLPEHLPELYEAMHLGPRGRDYSDEDRTANLLLPGSFQTADVAFMATAHHPINANHPGTGKTLEAIASVFEEGIEDGPKIVIAPLTSLETVWVDELSKWQYQDIILCFGSKNRREDAVAAAQEYVKEGEPFWFVTNPETLRMQAVYEEDPITGVRTGKRKLFARYPQLFDIEWNIAILDEFQKMGLANDTLTSKGMFKLKKKKGLGLSGTPIKGKPINLWGILRFLEPEAFSSKWKFADQWLVVTQGAYGKQIGDVRKEKEADFWDMIGRYMIRRTKDEVLPWLPPKLRIDKWIDMTSYQQKQYDTFAENAEIRIEEERLSATGILAEYTRLKQFSFSVQRIESQKDPPYFAPFPTADSNKLPYVEEILEELGIIHTKREKDESSDSEWSGEQVIIFSQFTRVIDFVDEWLQEKHGVRTSKITGKVTGHNRTIAQREFQSDDADRPQVMLMNTLAGGTAITLDNANTVIFLDETWVPDEQEQAEDRIHRASRVHQVTIYYLRSKGSIEEYIYRRVRSKDTVNTRILDLRRAGLRANAAPKEEAA